VTALPNKHYSGHHKTTERKRKTKEHLEKRFRERHVNSQYELQLEKDGSGSTKQLDGEMVCGLYHKFQ